MTTGVGIIYGHRALASNQADQGYLADAFTDHGYAVYQAADSVAINPRRDDVHETVCNVFAACSHPVIFGLLNGRGYRHAASASAAQLGLFQRSSIPPQPQFLTGHPDGARNLMRSIVAEATKTGSPVDVFLLTASRPDFIHKYASKLPAGSTVIAVQTAAEMEKHTPFWGLVEDPVVHGRKKPSAYNLLQYFLCTDAPMVRKPEIAVSGKPRRHLNDVWEYYAQDATANLRTFEALEAEQYFQAIEPYMASSQALKVENAKNQFSNSARNNTLPKPQGSASYAWALATMWDRLYGDWADQKLRKTASSKVALRTKPVQAASPAPAKRTAAPAPAANAFAGTQPDSPHKRPRLTSSQVGSLYRPGKPIHQQHPAVVRRLLGKG